MNEVPTLVTPRLLLRQWRESDLAPFTALNSDPVVMEHFPAVFSEERTREAWQRHRDALDAGRPGLYAVERRDSGEFIGFVGLAVPRFEATFTPCVEIGWRLTPSAWGQGFASEGARASLAHGFDVLGLDEIVSFTARRNSRSEAVMRRIGMHRSREFEHPSIPRGHPMRPQVLYRVTAAEWHASVSESPTR